MLGAESMFRGTMYGGAEEKQTNRRPEDHARVHQPYERKDGHAAPLVSSGQHRCTEVTGAEPQNLPPSSSLTAAHKKDLQH